MENLKEYSSLPDYVEYCGWACVCVCVHERHSKGRRGRQEALLLSSLLTPPVLG